MARIRLEGEITRVECMEQEIVEAALYRIIRDLGEALDRTPATLTSRSLIEGALRLALGAYEHARRLADECRAREH